MNQSATRPKNYRTRKGRDMNILYTIEDSPFGRLLIATSEVGICAVSMGDDDEFLVKALHDEYPAANIRHNKIILEEAIQKVLEALSGRQPVLDLAVDIRASTFRLKVYEALKTIPYGQTRSYEEIAQAIGRPKAVRAVANACAGNPVALLIPCHRVIRKDGSLGGYKWGLTRKEKILKLEKDIASKISAQI